MSFLERKMTNLIDKEIQTPYGPCIVIGVDNEFVELKDFTENTFKVPLWKFAL